MVAFTQNCRDEVRQINGDGQIAGALSADSGSHQTNYVAYDVHGTLATKGASQTDCHTALRSRPPGQSEASTTTVVATPIDMRQASRGEKITNQRASGSGGPPGNGIGENGDPAFTVSERGQAVAFAIDGGNQAASEEIHHSLRTGRDSGDAVAQGFTYSGYSNQPAWMTGDRTDCLPSSGHSDGSHQGVGVCLGSDEVAGTLRSNPGSGWRSNGTPVEGVVITPMAVRRLTPLECCRLQGFPDGYTAIQYRGKPAADGQQYRALGNSMAVPVMAWIGNRIQMVSEMEATDGR